MGHKQKDSRTIERLREHYEIEKRLANKLKHASREERKYLYTELYNDLYIKVPDHPRWTNKLDKAAREKAVASQIDMLKPLLSKEVVFMEIGPGDCRLSFEVAKYVKKVIAVDVSDIITKHEALPYNFELIISNGSNIDVKPNTVNVAYSNQVIEHLHPEDTIIQLKNIYTSLVKGGVYLCITPHRFLGPHDISQHFDEVATGFHLKEYTYCELLKMFKDAEFSRINAVLCYKGIYLKLPVWVFNFFEKLFYIPSKLLPQKVKISLANRQIFGIKINAIK
jgi:hypothetical protein